MRPRCVQHITENEAGVAVHMQFRTDWLAQSRETIAMDKRRRWFLDCEEDHCAWGRCRILRRDKQVLQREDSIFVQTGLGARACWFQNRVQALAGVF